MVGLGTFKLLEFCWMLVPKFGAPAENPDNDVPTFLIFVALKCGRS